MRLIRRGSLDAAVGSSLYMYMQKRANRVSQKNTRVPYGKFVDTTTEIPPIRTLYREVGW